MDLDEQISRSCLGGSRAGVCTELLAWEFVGAGGVVVGKVAQFLANLLGFRESVIALDCFVRRCIRICRRDCSHDKFADRRCNRTFG